MSKVALKGSFFPELAPGEKKNKNLSEDPRKWDLRGPETLPTPNPCPRLRGTALQVEIGAVHCNPVQKARAF